MADIPSKCGNPQRLKFEQEKENEETKKGDNANRKRPKEHTPPATITPAKAHNNNSTSKHPKYQKQIVL